jgi:hypothetical protein
MTKKPNANDGASHLAKSAGAVSRGIHHPYPGWTEDLEHASHSAAMRAGQPSLSADIRQQSLVGLMPQLVAGEGGLFTAARQGSEHGRRYIHVCARRACVRGCPVRSGKLNHAA